MDEEPAIPPARINVEHQLSLYLSNADGHVGYLCLPVPTHKVEIATAMVESWHQHEVPLLWGGRSWATEEEFAELRETALNMPDLLLLGLETELAMALTPDWTWEKYPMGFGEVALREAVEQQQTSAEGAGQVADEAATGTEQTTQVVEPLAEAAAPHQALGPERLFRVLASLVGSMLAAIAHSVG